MEGWLEKEEAIGVSCGWSWVKVIGSLLVL